MTFAQMLEKISDGKAYKIKCAHVNGWLEKAPFPSIEAWSKRDGALSALTFHGRKQVFLLDDFTDADVWVCKEIPKSMWPK